MDLRFASVDWSLARTWMDRAVTGAPVTPGMRTAFAAGLGVFCDVLADPARVLNRDGTLYLPSLAAAGNTARTLVVGAVPYPAQWRDASRYVNPPSGLPASGDWITSTDAYRRMLYGSLRAMLTQLAGSGAAQPVQPSAGAFPLAGVMAVALTGPVGLAAWGIYQYREHADVVAHETTEQTRAREAENTRRVQIIENGTTARYATMAATQVQLYQERLKVFRSSGTMPAASTAEAPLATPQSGQTAYTPNDPNNPAVLRQQSTDFWQSVRSGGYVAAAAGVGLVLVAAGAGWVWMQQEKAAALAAGGLLGDPSGKGTAAGTVASFNL